MSIATLSCHFTLKLCKTRSITFANSLPYLPSRRLFHLFTNRRHTMYKITLINPDGTEHEFDARDDTYILDAAKKAGVELKSSCESGICSTCTGKIKSGKVEQSEGSFLTDSQKDDGYMLTCISKPRSHCVIYTDKEDELYTKKN